MPVDISVAVMTYNHENFIADTLLGIFRQKFEGTIQLIISEDASTDGTAKAIKKFLDNTVVPPNIDVAFTSHAVNQGMFKHFAWVLQQATGKYIAFCEGDDYWTDPLKLHHQFQILEKNPRYVLVFSNTDIESTNGCSHEDLDLHKVNENRIFSAVEILEHWTIPFNTVLFRNVLDDDFFSRIIPNKNFMFADIVLFLYLAQKGQLYGTVDCTAVYRRHEHNLTLKESESQDYSKKMRHFTEIIKVFGKKYRTPVILEYLSRYRSFHLNQLLRDQRYLMYLYKRLFLF